MSCAVAYRRATWPVKYHVRPACRDHLHVKVDNFVWKRKRINRYRKRRSNNCRYALYKNLSDQEKIQLSQISGTS